MEKEIHKSQISLLELAKKYLQNCQKRGVNIKVSPLCDFVIWTECLGNEKVKLLQQKKFLSLNFFYALIKEFFSIGKNSQYFIRGSILNNKKKIKVIYSYCSKESFSKKGFFYDKYFNYSSNKNKDIYWFLISSDNYIPKKLDNIIIVYRDNSSYNSLYILKYFIKSFFKKNFIHNFNNTLNFSNIYANLFYKVFKNHKFDLYLPFENRPHQNLVIEVTKKISKKNKVYGYYHRMPEPLQSEMFYKNSILDRLYVCSKIQKNVFCKIFNWPSNKIKIINSIRYPVLAKRKNFIFLSFNIKKNNLFIQNLKIYLEKSKSSINNFKISIHPLKKNNKVHIDLSKKIKNDFINTKSNKKNLNLPIILGEPGSIASEMLETNKCVAHISDNYLNIFSGKIWNNIKVQNIYKNIFIYKKKTQQTLIKRNGRKDNFSKIL